MRIREQFPLWRAERLADGKLVAIKIPKDQEKGEEILRKKVVG